MSYITRYVKEFWKRGEDSIQSTFELTESKRTKDKWLQAVLQADRMGEETYEMYCFTHGVATKIPGSGSPKSNTVDCGQESCMLLARKWEEELYEESQGGLKCRKWTAASGGM